MPKLFLYYIVIGLEIMVGLWVGTITYGINPLSLVIQYGACSY